MRLDIRYRTRFDYAAPVRESVNELRACPASDEHQQLVSYRVVTEPHARVLSSLDYWGTRVDTFSIREPHAALEVLAEAVVETEPAAERPAPVRLEALRDPEFVDAHVEYVARSAHVDWGQRVGALVREHLAAPPDEVGALVEAVHEAVAGTLAYTSGATYVGVSIEELLVACEGVCQDYAHLAVAVCRSLGVPARYVSGYLFTADDATGDDVEGDLVRVQTHAWFEAAVPGHGWWALDPTNRQHVGERHVKIGHGRDYDDVMPLRGAFSGPSAHDLSVEVEMRRDARPQHPAPTLPPAHRLAVQAVQQE